MIKMVSGGVRMEKEKLISIPVRLPESLSRRFKASCALDGISAQEFFERAAKEYANKKLPE
jgi:hypothetical protein